LHCHLFTPALQNESQRLKTSMLRKFVSPNLKRPGEIIEMLQGKSRTRYCEGRPGRATRGEGGRGRD